jgi:photoactive yellow protein
MVDTTGGGAVDATVVDSIERLASMTQEEVDELPYGFVVLDAEGFILLYNRYEARLARYPAERAVGRNFFSDVAPCTRVEAFHGRFRALVEGARQDDRFAFRFHFLHGAQDVMVHLTRAPEGGLDAAGSSLAEARVFMQVERRRIELPGTRTPDTLAFDAEAGRAAGPLGPVLPLAAPHLTSLLWRIGKPAAREVGRSIGEAIAARAGEQVPALDQAPGQLAAGALDDALGRAGFGRLALDLTPRADQGILGCLVRPAVEVGSAELGSLYEGLLEAALSAATGEPLAARCLDDRDLSSFPWRFALAPFASAQALEARPGESPDEVARRLGLLSDEGR